MRFINALLTYIYQCNFECPFYILYLCIWTISKAIALRSNGYLFKSLSKISTKWGTTRCTSHTTKWNATIVTVQNIELG
ncbi:unnamed protein product [Rotaria socialis]|uniref:Uncharacterized protein n=1 Tax=Rotaria socialis TaxID=392032 RepID=A0A818P416_9BILA|nr:unnamed protein product [Rotaria socialis]CAF3617193.1 unnamed protein product [Rotaria socialis]CAF4195857.1 unnamed protein product [Rotaria socialis]CAF4325524.1 unnamed protein product [Rotaria socialis]CAF4979675.1 unnamed protein product [Rotaria socialis]